MTAPSEYVLESLWEGADFTLPLVSHLGLARRLPWSDAHGRDICGAIDHNPR